MILFRGPVQIRTAQFPILLLFFAAAAGLLYPPAGAVVTGLSRQQTVTAAVQDGSILMRSELPPGYYLFEVQNRGEAPHSLRVEGQGYSAGLDSALKSGEKGSFFAELKPGIYTVFCPVRGHQEQGELFSLRVADVSRLEAERMMEEQFVRD